MEGAADRPESKQSIENPHAHLAVPHLKNPRHHKSHKSNVEVRNYHSSLPVPPVHKYTGKKAQDKLRKKRCNCSKSEHLCRAGFNAKPEDNSKAYHAAAQGRKKLPRPDKCKGFSPALFAILHYSFFLRPLI